ncbi:type II toxin-antitoxin system HicB family antitoxin [Lysobacter capsici]|uniref:type II toxin-antitoxin system HicB family antitoxin n=1 Tax=Lysobacter capsici TaxID=435897 RepID=UPI001C004E67|nr:type II toxin-antitoxin system HicB family antitoxin [Lysobacter capsici]QWF19136.1 type II toxin-antitoxin system HicB family antitoxin [Lysobacter capsici]
MLKYPARIEPDGAGFLVTFRDIPEALTSGSTQNEALEMASDALATAMDFYFEDRRTVPIPSKPKKDEVLVALSASVSAKVLLLNQMLENSVTPAQLARRMQTSPQVINRIVDLHHATKIDTIAQALSAMGKQLVISVV